MYTNRPVLPEDIRKIVTRSVAKRVIPCIILEFIMLWYVIFFGEMSFRMVGIEVRILIYIVLILLPFIITGVPLKLIDRSWKGEIVAINVDMGLDRSVYGRGVREVSYLVLKIKRDDGKVIEHTMSVFSHSTAMKSNRARSEFAEDDYAVGDKVYHYYGIKRLLIIHKDKSRECVICGSNNPEKNDRCFYCGHSIIKKTF
ncbi:MAG: hypothetical protein J6M03_04945 [Clostridia bacterium]|nr:hypothetical protein [Clostridia bacterium]